MSQETKAKRLASFNLRALATELDDEVQGLKAEQEWLNDAPTRPDTQEGQPE